MVYLLDSDGIKAEAAYAVARGAILQTPVRSHVAMRADRFTALSAQGLPVYMLGEVCDVELRGCYDDRLLVGSLSAGARGLATPAVELINA